MNDIPFELAAQAARLIVIATCIAVALLFAEHHLDKPSKPWKRRK
jgi:hypothetical protein